MDSFQKKRCISARRLSIVPTLQVWLRVSQNISSACIVLVSKMETNPGIDFSDVRCGAFVSFLWLSFPPCLKPWRLKRWQYRWRVRWAMRGMLRKSGAKSEKAKVRAPRRRRSSWRRRRRRPWESIWGCSVAKEALSNRSRVKPVEFPGAMELDIPFSHPHRSNTRRTCVLWFSRSSLSV